MGIQTLLILSLYLYGSVYSQITPVLGDVRLVGSDNAGRLEFYRFNEWTSVCPTNFKLPAADWVCRKLGYKYSKKFHSASILGYPVGRSRSITKIVCSSRGCSAELCISSHSQDIAIECTNDTSPIRLISESKRTHLVSAGRLEININGEWGTVCEDTFSKREADVACRHLGYVKADSYTSAKSIGYKLAPSSSPIWLDNLECSILSASNDNLRSCSLNGPKRACSHADDVILSCAYAGSLRVVQAVSSGNQFQTFGRLEIFWNGMWGAVCNKPNFTRTSAEVACKQLGFTDVDCYGISSQFGINFADLSVSFFLDDVNCNSSSIDILTKCSDRLLGTASSSCQSSSDDVALSCTTSSNSTRHPYCSQKKIGLAGAISGAIFGVLAIAACCVIGVLTIIKKMLLPSHRVDGNNVGLIALAAIANKSDVPSITLANPGLQHPSVPAPSSNTTQLPNAAYPQQASPQQPFSKDSSKQPGPQFKIDSGGSVLHDSPPPSYNATITGQAVPNYSSPSY